jgi:DNA-binding transcriptional MerR regulator
MEATLLDIGEVSRRTGLAPSALRFYEAEGLVTSRTRKGLRRQYDAEALQRLAMIMFFRDSSFSLDEIRQILATEGNPAWKDVARAKHAEIVRQIDRLQAMRAQLEHALQCPSPNLLQCPHLRQTLAATGINH